jgi:hypothetical protein
VIAGIVISSLPSKSYQRQLASVFDYTRLSADCHVSATPQIADEQRDRPDFIANDMPAVLSEYAGEQ